MFRPLGGIYRVEVCNEPQLAAPLAVALAAAPVAQLFPEYISGAHQLNFVIDAAVKSVQSRCSLTYDFITEDRVIANHR